MDAFIGLVGILFGILLGKGLERVLDERKRADRQVDMIFALHAEISAGFGTVSEQTAPDEAAYLIGDEWPFGPSDRTDFVFESLKSDLSVLPQGSIHSVVRYYRLAEQSNIMIDHLQTQDYVRQTPAEKKRYATKIIEVLTDQRIAANAALLSLERSIKSFGMTVPKREIARSDERLDGSKHVHSPLKRDQDSPNSE